MAAPVVSDAPAASADAARLAWRRSWKPWVPLFIVLGLALAVGTFAGRATPTNEERVLLITKNVKCPTCSGQSVAESNADLSKEIRTEITKRVDTGQTDDQIYDFLEQKYNAGILLTPTSSGVTGLVWIVPVAALVIALAGLGVAFRRWGQRPDAPSVTDADRELVAGALAAEHARQHGDSLEPEASS